MQRRANLLILIGVAVFVLGGALVFLALRNNGDDSSASTAPTGKVSVVVATHDIDPGTLGDKVLSSNDVTVKQVPAAERDPNAVSSTAALNGHIVVTGVDKGTQITSSNLRIQSVRAQSITIPAGKQAVAVTLPFTPAVAAYAAPGDMVNVYAVVKPGDPGAPATAPYTKLIVSNAQVLDVSQEVAPQAADITAASNGSTAAAKPRTGEGTLTFLLALDPANASKVIFTSEMNDLYFTVVHKGDGPSSAAATTYANVNP